MNRKDIERKEAKRIADKLGLASLPRGYVPPNVAKRVAREVEKADAQIVSVFKAKKGNIYD